MREALEVDKVGDVSQKERKLAKAGATRDKAYTIIAESMDAVKKVRRFNEKMDEVEVEEPDHARRQWGVEKMVELLGDKSGGKVEVSGVVTHEHNVRVVGLEERVAKLLNPDKPLEVIDVGHESVGHESVNARAE